MWEAGRKLFTPRATTAPPPATPKTDLGVATLSQAVEQGRRYTTGQPGASAQEPIRLYEEGADLVLEGIRSEPNSEARKAELRELVASCITRAEALKQTQRTASGGDDRGGPSGGRGGNTAGGRGAAGGRGRGAASAAGRSGGRPTPASGRGGRGPAAAEGGGGIGRVASGSAPRVRWEEVAGLDKAKAALQEAAVLPIRFPELFTGERRPWRGILLYGPPGTGKSRLAQAVATEVDAAFFSVTSSDLVSKWVGESEKQVRALFEQAAAARPAVIFIDEVDALASARTDSENDATRRLKNELLVRMSEAARGVLVLAATNVPWALDPAVRRRFERRIHVPLPEAEARAALLRIHLGATPHELSDRALLGLASRLHGFSGADLSVLVRDALMEPVRMLQAATHFRQEADGAWAMCEPNERGAVQMRLMQVPPQQLRTPHVTLAHLERAMLATRPSVGPEDLHRFEEFTRLYGAGN